MRGLSRKTAIVGVGETDYPLDYAAARARAVGYEPPSPEGMALVAFERALADAGLERAQIDALYVSFTYGGPDPQSMARQLRLAPRYAIANGSIMAGPLPRVCADIAAGKANTVAMIYSVASRAIGRRYGGSTYSRADVHATPSSYYFHHPWGWSSQAAHWAMMFTYYQYQFGASEEDLGAVAVQVRRNAIANPNAVMRKPLSIDDYMSSRYIVRPLRLFDLCLVNDGAVCLIVTRADRAAAFPHTPVLVAGWGESKVRINKMHSLVRERLRPQMQDALGQALAMAGMRSSEIGHVEGYDISTIHLISQLEGYGFVEPGSGLAFCREGGMAVDGRLPVNTGGGNLSGSYMHGWSQIVEIVHQLRHEARDRQIANAQASLFSLVQTDQVHPLLFVRGA